VLDHFLQEAARARRFAAALVAGQQRTQDFGQEFLKAPLLRLPHYSDHP